MQAPVQQRQQGRNHVGTLMKEKEEELALFLEMRKREKEKNNLLLLHNSEEFDTPLGSKPGSSPIFKIVSSMPPRKTPADDFLNSESDKNDYDWLLTPPGTPLFPSLEMESQKTVMSQIGTPKARPTALKSRLANPQPELASRSNLVSKQPTLSPGLNSSSAATRRPSSSGGREVSKQPTLSPGLNSSSAATRRPSSSGGREVSKQPTLSPGLNSSGAATRRPSSSGGREVSKQPTLPPGLNSSNAGIRRPSSSGAPGSTASRPATPTGRPTLSATAKPSRPSTPTSRATLPSSKPTAPPQRSSNPSARSSTPTARPTVPASKPTSRSATPTRRPSTPSSVSAPPVRSSSVTKTGPTTMRNPVPSRGSSPTVKSRPWKPSEMPGFSLDAPPNLRTSLPERPVSASRGRSGAPSVRSSSVEAGSNGRPRRQSSSPSRGRAPNGSIHSSGSSVPAVSRAHSNGSDNVSPVLIGTKMVERVVNMRKLAPPKQDDQCFTHNNPVGKSSSSPDSLGFGRTLSKKSLDMALRHMDIRRSIPGSLRPLMTNIPASSMYSVRSGPTRSRAVSVSDSPLATSSYASSEQSVNDNTPCLDASEVEDYDLASERGGRSSPASQCGR